jgi:hypothetical protein
MLPSTIEAKASELVGATAEKPLDASLWRLITGEIGLQDCTPALRAWYQFGFDDGRKAAQTEIGRLELQLANVCRERDSLYERLTNPGKKLSQMKQRRIDQAVNAEFENGIPTESELVTIMVNACTPVGADPHSGATS